MDIHKQPGRRKRPTLPSGVNAQLKRLHTLAEQAKVPNPVLIELLGIKHTSFYFMLRGAQPGADEVSKARELADRIDVMLQRGEAHIAEKLKAKPRAKLKDQ